MESLAKAAGVVRRTLYGHFPDRQALVMALAKDAGRSLNQAVISARRPGASPSEAGARMVLAAWAVGDRYRMLVAVARRVGVRAFRAALAPTREEVIAIVARGQTEGVFADYLPPELLAQLPASIILGFLEADLEEEAPRPTGDLVATAVLLALGVPIDTARRAVKAALETAD